MLILAGDIGGTKTLLQLADCSGKDGPQVVAESAYPSREYQTFDALLDRFAGSLNEPVGIDAACFAVAGPVIGGNAKITNLPWALDAAALKQRLNVRCLRLLNDMQGMAYGIEALGDAELQILQAGQAENHGTRALLGVGTGLGIGFMVWAGDRYINVPSEGGHADLAPRDGMEIELLHALQSELGQVSWETVLSGPGLVRIYEHIRRGGEQSPGLTEAMRSEDPSAAIARFAMQNRDRAAAAALERFANLLGAKAAGIALTALTTGGVYLVGGIAPKILPILKSGIFMKAFLHNRTMGALLSRIPVRIVMNPNSALLGARSAAIEMLGWRTAQ
jgi:glucokinase